MAPSFLPVFLVVLLVYAIFMGACFESGARLSGRPRGPKNVAVRVLLYGLMSLLALAACGFALLLSGATWGLRLDTNPSLAIAATTYVVSMTAIAYIATYRTGQRPQRKSFVWARSTLLGFTYACVAYASWYAIRHVI